MSAERYVHVECPECPRVYLCRRHHKLCCDNCKACDCELIPFEKLDIKTVRDEILPKAMSALEARITATDLTKDINLKVDELKSKAEETKAAVHKRFQELHDALNKREADLIKELDAICENDCYTTLSHELPDLSRAKEIHQNGKKFLTEIDDSNPKEMIAVCCDVKQEANRIERLVLSADRASKETVSVKFCEDPTFADDIMAFGEISLLKTLSDEVEAYSWKAPFGAPSEKERKYMIPRENPRRVTRVNGDEWCIVIGSSILPLERVLSWKIKVEKSIGDDGDCICMGITPFDEDEGNCSFEKIGWYYNCYNGKLWSGPPHNYCWKEYGKRFKEGTNIKSGDEVGVIMDTKKGQLSFVVHGQNYGIAFDGIPLDRPLVPAVLLAWEGDTVEIIPEKY